MMDATRAEAELPDADRRIRDEQIALLYQGMPVSVIATCINAIVLIAVEWDVTEHRLALGWLGLIALITLVRYLLTRYYHRHKHEQGRSDFFEKSFIAGTIAAGVAWGSTAFLLLPEHSMAHQVFLAFIVGGMCAGAVTTLTSSLTAIFGFISLSLLPLMVHFFMAGNEIANAMGLMVLLFLVMISVSSMRNFRNIRLNIELRIKSEYQESTIRQQKLELRAILDNAPVGIWLVGADGRYRFVNKTFCDAIGADEEQFLTATDLAEVMGEEAAASCLASDRDCFASETPQLSHETLTFVDGKEHLMEITKAKVRDHNGEVTGAIGIGIDITDKQTTEERLRILSQAVEQAGESIVITGNSGEIEYVNPAFTELTGYTLEEVINKNPRVLKSGIHSPSYYERLWKTISSGKIWHSSVIDMRKDGSTYPAHMTISPIINEKGEITHYVGIQQDMTDRNMLEEQFRQSQKMEALGTLVGGIAHDFNNILTGISGNVVLARFEVEPGSALEQKLQVAEDLSYKAADMIKQLMLFSRKGLIDMKPFGLTSFIENITGLIQSTIPENIQFECRFNKGELVVNGDSTQIEQVLINLLNNARDAVSAAANPRISLTIDKFEADDLFIEKYPDVDGNLLAHIAVSDNGCGISESDLQHIFEPFFTTKEVGLGTGLGLSMAYGAVQSHRGALDVVSKPGEGTTFHIYLPIMYEEMVENDENAAEAVPGNDELVLVVDDNADVRNTMEKILTSLNYRVLQAIDGLEAVDVFRTHKDEIDIVVMDVVMPRLGGVKAAERIMKIKPDVKVVFATGYDRNDTLRSEMPSEEYSIIAKPFSVSSLSRIIRKHLDA